MSANHYLSIVDDLYSNQIVEYSIDSRDVTEPRGAIDRLRTSLITLPNETDRSAHCVALVGTKKFLIVTQL